MTDNQDMLEIMADSIGYDSPTEMLAQAGTNDPIPSICLNCHTVKADDISNDALYVERCEECGSDDIKSCFDLALNGMLSAIKERGVKLIAPEELEALTRAIK